MSSWLWKNSILKATNNLNLWKNFVPKVVSIADDCKQNQQETSEPVLGYTVTPDDKVTTGL